MIYPHAKLIQFARYPEPGKVKTRLRGALEDKDILRLHCQLVHTTNTVLNESGLAPVEFWYGCEDELPVEETFLPSLSAENFYQQPPGDLGEKMYLALERTLDRCDGAVCAALVGSDCPFIDQALLDDTFSALYEGADVVLGPAEDGGYYLVAVKEARRELFDNIVWGSADVLAQTLRQIEGIGWRCQLLTKLADIDVPGDIPKLYKKSEFAWLKNKYIL